MNYIISGKNIEVTEGLRNAVQDKLSKLEKYSICKIYESYTDKNP